MSMGKTKTEIACAIRRGVTYYKDIAIDLGKTEGNIRKTLSVMTKAGQAIPMGAGHYHVPDMPPDDPMKKTGPEPLPDYNKSNETALRLLVKTRYIVDDLIDKYNEGKTPFPKEEIASLKMLELAYKDELQRRAELARIRDENKKRKSFILLPHNDREELTLEQRENHGRYNHTQLHLTNEPPTDAVIIESDEKQLYFPFYSL